jgi:hypothetical protein
LLDESVLIMKRNGGLYEWGEKAVFAYCPAHYSDISPFLMVRYSDKTWSLCHAEAGPMPGAIHIMEKEAGVCPIEFKEDFLEEKTIAPKESCFKKILKGLASLGTVITGHKKTNQKMAHKVTQTVTENGVGDINIQHMTGADKYIENYERMVTNLFEEQKKTPQRVVTHVGGIKISNEQENNR